MTTTPFCDGIQRRSLLRVGAASLFGSCISMPRILKAASPHDRPARDTDVSLIYIFLKGGLSTIDSFDLKPNAPAEFRGEFSPIKTRVPGIEICELLPKIAGQMDKLSLVRGFGHRNSDHGPADHYMLTGYHPLAGFNPNLNPNNQRPSIGSIISRKTNSPTASRGIPPYVCLPRLHPSAGPAYLGSTCAALAIESDPAAPDFAVPDLLPPLTVDAGRLGDRRQLLKQLDHIERTSEVRANAPAQAVSVFRQKAFDLMTSADARRAFDLQSEPAKLRDEYGRTTIGQSCLMARRLVEAGVRCVTVEHSNWDTHESNFAVLKRDLLPQFDPAIATLFKDLADRRILEKTLVVITGEFGRTPRINKNAGRDHWGPAFTVVLGGGGLQGGRVVGASDAKAERPADQPHGPENLMATICTQLGIDPNDEFLTPEGRPVKVVNDASPIAGLT
jgi:hypothetical protein